MGWGLVLGGAPRSRYPSGGPDNGGPSLCLGAQPHTRTGPPVSEETGAGATQGRFVNLSLSHTQSIVLRLLLLLLLFVCLFVCCLFVRCVEGAAGPGGDVDAFRGDLEPFRGQLLSYRILVRYDLVWYWYTVCACCSRSYVGLFETRSRPAVPWHTHYY